MRVIHVAHRGSVVFIARNLETEDEAVIVTEPVPRSYWKLPRRKNAWEKPKRGGRW